MKILLVITICSDKILLLTGGSIGGLLLLVKRFFGIEKSGTGDAVGKGRWSGGPFEKSAYLLVESYITKTFLSTIQPNFFLTIGNL